MVPGEIIVRKAGHDYSLAVGERLDEVSGDPRSHPDGPAIGADETDEAKVEEASQRTEARLPEEFSEEEVSSVNSSLARSPAQLHVKRRRHR
jgi:hypothetical protein